MKTRFYLLTMLLFSLSCTKTVDLQLGKLPSKIVVNSFFEPDSVFRVLVSHPIPIDETGRPVIDNATVQLFEDGAFVENLTYQDFFYHSQHVAQTGKTYQLKVSVPENYPETQAVDSVPSPPVVTSIELIKDFAVDYSDNYSPSYISRLNLQLNDDLSQRNYYEVFAVLRWKSNSQDYRLIRLGYEKNDCEIINHEEMIGYRPVSLVFSNELFTSNEQEIHIDLNSGNAFDHVDDISFIIYIRKISYAYYRYQKSWTLHNYFQDSDEDFWGTPMPVELYSNVTNGLGIFAAYNEVRDTLYFN